MRSPNVWPVWMIPSFRSFSSWASRRAATSGMGSGSGSGSGSRTGMSSVSASEGVSPSGGMPAAGMSASVTNRSASNHDRLTPPALGEVLVLDALLEQHDALQQGLRAGRAAGDVDVDGDDLVDPLGDAVGVPVRAAAVGTAPHRDHVLRVGHLVVEPPDRRGHLVGDRARNDEEVGLAGAGRERDDTEAHHVVAGTGE